MTHWILSNDARIPFECPLCKHGFLASLKENTHTVKQAVIQIATTGGAGSVSLSGTEYIGPQTSKFTYCCEACGHVIAESLSDLVQRAPKPKLSVDEVNMRDLYELALQVQIIANDIRYETITYHTFPSTQWQKLTQKTSLLEIQIGKLIRDAKEEKKSQQ